MNNYGNYTDVVVGVFQAMAPFVLSFALKFVIALALLLIGYILGSFISKLIQHLFTQVKVDLYLRKAGVEEPLRRGGVNLNSGLFIGSLVKYFVVVIFLIASFSVIGLNQVNIFLQQVVLSYLPLIIVSVLMLLVGVVVGDVMQKIVRASALAAHIKAAGFLGSVTKWSIWVLTVLTVLVQLQIAANLIQILFAGVVVAGAIAFGLAFGLGGQAHANQFIQKIKEEISQKN